MVVPVHYVKTDRGYVAYQTVGDSGPDLLFLPDMFGNLDAQWDEPTYARTLHRLSEVGRLVMVNRRGIGVADPLPLDEELTLDGACHDLIAVLDAIGTEAVAVIAAGGAAPLAVTLAVREPDRVSALVLLGAWVALRRTDDYPIGLPDDALDIAPEVTERAWGTGMLMQFGAPDRAEDPREREFYARMERLSASPTTARKAQQLAIDTDVRDLLAQVTAPTAVIHRASDPVIPVELGRYIADHVEGASFLVLPGSAHLFFGDSPLEWIEEVRHLLTGSRVATVDQRILRTMLFSDIVGSTSRAAAVGDERWQDQLIAYESLLSAEITASGGTLVNATGDGHLATFERPMAAIRCARRLGRAAAEVGLEVRCGLHTGEVEVHGDDLAGLAVHLAARVANEAGPSEVLVSRTVVDLVVGSAAAFESRGEHELKGVPGRWELYAVVDR